MNVAELIDILRDLDPETIVEMAIVAPVTDHSEDITVDLNQCFNELKQPERL